MTPKGESHIWWHSVKEYHHHLRLPPISDWEVMIFKLQKKYGAKHHVQYPQPLTRKQPTQTHKPSPPLCDNVRLKSPNSLTHTPPPSQPLSPQISQDSTTTKHCETHPHTTPPITIARQQSKEINTQPPPISSLPCDPSKPPNTPTHLKPASSAVQNPKEIPSENQKQPTLIPHPRVDTQNSNLSIIIHKPIQTQQATLTQEFSSLPQPISQPLPPKDPKSTTTQEHTKISIPTFEQPNPLPTPCRDP
jgi:hypothetical protein